MHWFNYVYVSSPSNGDWLTDYNSKQYGEILKSKDFENISSVFVTRIEKKNGTSQINEIKYSGHGQGFEIYGDYFYVVRDFDEENSEKIKINKYYIQDPTQYESLIIDITELYKGRTGIEAEGLSIYGGKLYLGITSKIGSIAYNDIY